MGEVLTIERGGSPRPIDKYLTNSPNGINWIKISDATASDKYIFETKEKITKEGLHKTRMVNEGDFILSNSMSFGRPYIMKTSGCIHDDWLVLKENGQKIFDTEFLYYLLSSPYVFNQFDYLAAGSTVRNLNIALVSSVQVPIPPLPEQQRIVSILDEAFACIERSRNAAIKNLKNAKELFESYLQGVFENGNCETKSFDEVCEISSKLIDPRKPEFQNLIHVGAGNIESKTGLLSGLKTAKEESLISGKFLFDESMVLYSKIRPYLMKVVNCDFQGLCSADIYPLKPFEKIITKDYLYHLLLTKEFTDYAILGSQRAGMPKVNREHLFAYKFKLPTLQKQQTIVRQLDALRAETQKLEAVYQKKIDDLEELKKSILQKAFAGELRGGEPAEPKTEKSRRDDKIIENKMNQARTNPEGVK